MAWRGEDKAPGQPRDLSGHDRIIHCWVQRDGGWFVRYTECVSLPLARQEPAPPSAPTSPVLPALPPLDPSVAPHFPEPLLLAPAPTPWKAGVRTSDAWDDKTPEKAFDDDHATMWNSASYAPAWIEKDLGAVTKLSSIALVVSQEPEGETTHEDWVSNEPIGNDRAGAKLVHTFKGNTKNLQTLKFDFPKDTTARYLEIRTTDSPSWVGWWEVEISVKAK